MSINTKTWANGDHISVTELQNLQDNSVNVTDDIHEQYDGITLLDGMIYGIGSDATAVPNNVPSFRIATPNDPSVLDSLRFNFPAGGLPRRPPLNKISFHVKNTVSIDIDFDYMTGNTTVGENSVFFQIFRWVDGGNAVLEHSGTERTSAAYTRLVIENFTMATLNASSTDFITVVTIGKVNIASSGRSAESKCLRVVRKF